MDEDKKIRLKQKLLQKVTPQHFGVSTYLLLNEQTPILEIANERDAVLKQVDLGISRHTDKRHTTLANIFMNNDLPKDEGELDVSNVFDLQFNMLIQNEKDPSKVTSKDFSRQQNTSANLDSSDIFNVSMLGAAALRSSRRMTHIEIAMERL